MDTKLSDPGDDPSEGEPGPAEDRDRSKPLTDAEFVEQERLRSPAVPRAVVPRWIQAIVLPLAILGFYELARSAGPVVPIFTIATIVALILNPLVKLLQRKLPHGLAILGSYLVVLALFAAIGVVIFDPVATEINHFANNVPALTTKANHELDTIQTWLSKHGIKVHLQKQGQSALQAIQKAVLKRSNSIVSFSKSVLSTLVTLSIDGVLTLVLSIYLLVYAGRIGDAVRRLMPAGDGSRADDYPLLVQKAVTSYVRGQITLILTMGAAVALVMWLFGVTGIFPDGSRFALFFGAFYGLMELIPYVGPIIGPVPALAVALFTHPISAVWVLIAAVVLQELEGHIVTPQVFRVSLRINPILVILALFVGEEIWGIAGALVALPVATILRETVVYLYSHLALEPWPRLATAAPEPVAPVDPPATAT